MLYFNKLELDQFKTDRPRLDQEKNRLASQTNCGARRFFENVTTKTSEFAQRGQLTTIFVFFSPCARIIWNNKAAFFGARRTQPCEAGRPRLPVSLVAWMA